jgi:hypothetical protein
MLIFHVYTSSHIPHSTFHVVIGCTEHSGALVFIYLFIFRFHDLVVELLVNLPSIITKISCGLFVKPYRFGHS